MNTRYPGRIVRVTIWSAGKVTGDGTENTGAYGLCEVGQTKYTIPLTAET